MKHLRLGTRASKLALWQAHHVQALLLKAHPGISVEIVPIKTQGDLILDQPLSAIGGKGLFLKEIEQALLDHQIDLAVHSMKDVPAKLPDGLEIAACLPREDSGDALISERNIKFADLPPGALVGSSSLRRVVQMQKKRSDLVYENLRGNVDTRLTKLESGEYQAIVLAVAGLKRLGLESRISERLNLIPAVAQGAIGIEMRSGEKEVALFLRHLNHESTLQCVTAERVFLRVLEGNCQVPLGCEVKVESKHQLSYRTFRSEPDGSKFCSEEGKCSTGEIKSRLEKIAQKFLSFA